MKQRIAEGVAAAITLYIVNLIAHNFLPEREARGVTWGIMCLTVGAVLRPHQYPVPRRHVIGAILMFSTPLIFATASTLGDKNEGWGLVLFLFWLMMMFAGIFLLPASVWHGLASGQESFGRNSSSRPGRTQDQQRLTRRATEAESMIMERKVARGAYRRMSTDTMLPRLRNSILPQLRTSRRKREVNKRNGSI